MVLLAVVSITVPSSIGCKKNESTSAPSAKTAATVKKAPETTKSSTAKSQPSKTKPYDKQAAIAELRQRAVASGRPELIAEPKKPKTSVSKSEIKTLDGGIIELGGIRIDPQQRSAEVPGNVNQTTGIIEYLAVTPMGKTHESVFTLKVEAVHLRLALTMIGLIPQKPKPGERQRATSKNSTTILVRYKARNGQPRERAASRFTYDRSTRKPMPESPWILTWARPEDEASMLLTGSLIATRYDEAAIVNASIDTGNPYAGDSVGLAVNERLVPPKGTPVTVVFIAKPTRTKGAKR